MPPSWQLCWAARVSLLRAPTLAGPGCALRVGGHALDYLAPNVVDSPLAAHLAGDRPAPYSICFRTVGEAKRLDPGGHRGCAN